MRIGPLREMAPGGEVAADRLLKAGKKVVIFERELIGGECAYWACIPSKTVLRPPEARMEVQKAAGVSGAELDWDEAAKYRDYMIRNLDDKAQVNGYAKQGAEVVKEEARLTGPGRIRAGDRDITAEHLIIATQRAEEVADMITNAGSVFIGNYSCESAGDYASGTNHTLPTNGNARAFSGVSTASFMKSITYQEVTAEGIRNLGHAVETMAAAENLEAHKRAISIRLAALGGGDDV